MEEVKNMEAKFALSGAPAVIVWLIGYAYFAICLQTIAKKTGTKDAWMAWVPVLNVFLMCTLGGKPGWWLILFCIPFVNIVMLIIVWMAIAEARNKPSWFGILMIVPFVNFVIPAVLAFGKEEVREEAQVSQE